MALQRQVVQITCLLPRYASAAKPLDRSGQELEESVGETAAAPASIVDLQRVGEIVGERLLEAARGGGVVDHQVQLVVERERTIVEVRAADRQLEHEGIVELRQGAGAFVSGNAGAKKLTDKVRAGQAIVAAAVEKLHARGVTDEEIRRLFEAELAGLNRIGDQRD